MGSSSSSGSRYRVLTTLRRWPLLCKFALTNRFLATRGGFLEDIKPYCFSSGPDPPGPPQIGRKWQELQPRTPQRTAQRSNRELKPQNTVQKSATYIFCCAVLCLAGQPSATLSCAVQILYATSANTRTHIGNRRLRVLLVKICYNFMRQTNRHSDDRPFVFCLRH